MEDFDLNLLAALDALLAEGSVTGAAQRLHLSVPATSRALGRLRRVFDDPLLVRAGREMVPTPLAATLGPRVRAVLAEARGLVDPRDTDLARLERTMTIRTNDAVVAMFGPDLLATTREEAPGIVLRLVGEGDEDVAPLRNGSVDLDVGMIRHTAPELVVERLYTDRFVAVTAPDHPLTRGPVTLARLCEHPHISISRRGLTWGPLDDVLTAAGLARTVVATVASATAAPSLLLSSDAVGLMTVAFARHAAATTGLRIVEVPATLPPLEISAAWHPRHAVDPAHRWLRAAVRRASAGVGSSSAQGQPVSPR